MNRLKQTQIDRFREAARDLGCDDDESRFDAALKKIAPKTPGDRRAEESADSETSPPRRS
jgi:hypothetical protein